MVIMATADETDAVGRELAWIGQAETLLAVNTDRSNRPRLALAVALVCVLLATLALWWRPGDVPVVIELTLLWSAVVVLWGLFWSARAWMRRT